MICCNNVDTLFYQNLMLDDKKVQIYNKAMSLGLIQQFDQIIITRLRRLYYGFLDGLIFMYYNQTDSSNIGSKVEFFTYVLKDKDYDLVQGITDSVRTVNFKDNGLDPLDVNVWIEVQEGTKTWVYDLFSMLKIERDVYYNLENPFIVKRIRKSTIDSLPSREEDPYSEYHNGFDFMLLKYIPDMEKNLDTHPFGELLKPELDRFKKQINYEELKEEVRKRRKKRS